MVKIFIKVCSSLLRKGKEAEAVIFLISSHIICKFLKMSKKKRKRINQCMCLEICVLNLHKKLMLSNIMLKNNDNK